MTWTGRVHWERMWAIHTARLLVQSGLCRVALPRRQCMHPYRPEQGCWHCAVDCVRDQGFPLRFTDEKEAHGPREIRP